MPILFTSPFSERLLCLLSDLRLDVLVSCFQSFFALFKLHGFRHSGKPGPLGWSALWQPFEEAVMIFDEVIVVSEVPLWLWANIGFGKHEVLGRHEFQEQ